MIDESDEEEEKGREALCDCVNSSSRNSWNRRHIGMILIIF